MKDLDDILKHHGVKGMKWGITRPSNRPGGTDGKTENASKKLTGKKTKAFKLRSDKDLVVKKGMRLARKAIGDDPNRRATTNKYGVYTIRSEYADQSKEAKRMRRVDNALGLVLNMSASDETLKHHGIKGMRWGVRRPSNRPGGADGKEESTKVADNRGGIQKRLDSMKRERQWNKILKEVNTLSTKDINAVTKRVKLENSLKELSKTKGVATKKDKEDYLRRENMSDAELSRKVTRLRAKDGLHKAVRDASKEQREFGEKVAQIGTSLGVKYALTKTIKPKDVLDAYKKPKESYAQSKKDVQQVLMDKLNSKVPKQSKP